MTEYGKEIKEINASAHRKTLHNFMFLDSFFPSSKTAEQNYVGATSCRT